MSVELQEAIKNLSRINVTFRSDREALEKVKAFLRDKLILEKQKLNDRLVEAEKQMSSWEKGGDEWFKVAYQQGYFIIKELLLGGDTTP